MRLCRTRRRRLMRHVGGGGPRHRFRRRRRFNDRKIGRRKASGSETAGHRLVLCPAQRDCALHFAKENLSFFSSGDDLASTALSATGSSTNFLSCAVILLPCLTSSNGTPRSIASRTRL